MTHLWLLLLKYCALGGKNGLFVLKNLKKRMAGLGHQMHLSFPGVYTDWS